MSEETGIDLKELMAMDLGSEQDIELQKAMIEEVERLRKEGKSDVEAIRLVFENNKLLH
ncbi:hypothetical protein [Endozoicomonas sp. OPT23]|uniref:hypothetical protein n=1 Tax=Endozoicomonas sp. OPT23 TaxID=2072845 RepID=UPI00129B4E50|nr:hypothetical protein [Endozoicomonas sp. OPT23]